MPCLMWSEEGWGQGYQIPFADRTNKRIGKDNIIVSIRKTNLTGGETC